MGSVGEYEELKKLRQATERIAIVLEKIHEELTNKNRDGNSKI